MAVYCMSDVHGQIHAFHRILAAIGFTENDVLYILGDVIDRGPWGIDLLRKIQKTPNMHLLLGNHELMMLDYFRRGDEDDLLRQRWNRNRNLHTLLRYCQLEAAEQESLLGYLESLPDHLEISIGGQAFYLVHGFPADNMEDRVWERPAALDIPAPFPGKQLIIGHTPVPFLTESSDSAVNRLMKKLERRGEHVNILHAPGFIDIDCGCGHGYRSCALSCLRLDDMQEFYMPVCTKDCESDFADPLC